MPWEEISSAAGAAVAIATLVVRGRRQKESTLAYIRAAMRFVSDVRALVFKRLTVIGERPVLPVRHEDKLAAVADLVAKAEAVAEGARKLPPTIHLIAEEMHAREKVSQSIQSIVEQMPAAIASAKGRHSLWRGGVVLKDKDVDGLLQEWRAMQPEDDG